MTILQEIRANRSKLEACARHHFAETTVTIGQKVTCLNCGGALSLTEAGSYIRGYEAHGGDAADIWPAFRARQP